MSALARWLKPPRALLLSLLALTLVSVSALAWFGWRLFEHERIAAGQRGQERLEQEAERIAASARRSLAGLAAGLESWDGSEIRDDFVDNGALLFLSEDKVSVQPAGRLLYYPVRAQEAEADPAAFADGEMFEFIQRQPEEALRVYERQATSPVPAVRAGALLRIARVLRALGRNRESRKAYTSLASVADTRVAGVPAEVVALHALAELSGSRADIDLYTRRLLERRWWLTRGQFAFYWSEALRLCGRPLPLDTTRALLSEAVANAWHGRARHADSEGQETIWIEGRPFFILWRGTKSRRTALVAPPASLLKAALAASRARSTFVDAEGRVVAGSGRDAKERAVLRTAAEVQLPWTLYVSHSPGSEEAQLSSPQRFLLLGIAVMVLFLIAGTYFIARAIRREAQVLRMQADFVSAVSHEFRSPLTSLRQLSEILAFGRVPSEDRRQLYYDTLVSETTRLQRVVEALLNFGKMEAGARQYRFETLDAAALVRRVVAEFEQQAAASAAHIEVDTVPSPCSIHADPDAIAVALRNLLDNAVKYSPDGPVIRVECASDREHVAIRVHDEGLGVMISERKAIFQKFVRGSAANVSHTKGSGVGLAMVRHIAEAHGGEVTLSSKTGRGSTFTLLLPAAEGSCRSF